MCHSCHIPATLGVSVALSHQLLLLASPQPQCLVVVMAWELGRYLPKGIYVGQYGFLLSV